MTAFWVILWWIIGTVVVIAVWFSALERARQYDETRPGGP